MLFRMPERNHIDEALLKRFKQQKNDSVPMSGPLLMVTFVLPKF